MWGFRFGFATLGCSGASQHEVLALADRHHCTMLELRCAEDEFVHPGLDAVEAGAIGRRFREAGIQDLVLSSYVRLAQEGTDQDTDLARQIELAGELGARGVRVFMGDPSDPVATGPTDGERRALARLAEAQERADAAGVPVLVESHDTHSTAQRLTALMTEVDRQVPGSTTGVIWDSAHTWTHGEEPTQSYAELAPWLAYVQVKDERSRDEPVPVMLGEGGYPIGELMEALQANDYDGVISLEWERKWHLGLPPLDEALRAYLPWLTGRLA